MQNQTAILFLEMLYWVLTFSMVYNSHLWECMVQNTCIDVLETSFLCLSDINILKTRKFLLHVKCYIIL